MSHFRATCGPITGLVLALVSDPVFAQAVDSSANVKAVMAAENAYWHGQITGDTAAMARVMAHDFESFYPGQGSIDRGQLLRMIRPTDPGGHEDLANWKIRDYGTTVVVTVDYRVSQGEKPTSQSSVTDVWARESGEWKLVFATFSDIAPPSSGP